MLLLRKTEDEGDIMKENMKKFVIIVAIVAALFFTYPVNMSRADREYVEEQLGHMEEKMCVNRDTASFVHISYTGKARTRDGYIIYGVYAVNDCYIGEKSGKVYIDTSSDGAEVCIYTDKNYNVLKVKGTEGVTSADYYRSLIKMFPLPVRIRMIGQSGYSYKDEDLEKGKLILRSRQSR